CRHAARSTSVHVTGCQAGLLPQGVERTQQISACANGKPPGGAVIVDTNAQSQRQPALPEGTSQFSDALTLNTVASLDPEPPHLPLTGRSATSSHCTARSPAAELPVARTQ